MLIGTKLGQHKIIKPRLESDEEAVIVDKNSVVSGVRNYDETIN